MKGREGFSFLKKEILHGSSWPPMVKTLLGYVRDAVDLDAKAFARKVGRLNGRPRRAVLAEHALVDAVHQLELADVDQEHAAAQHVRQIGASGLENGLDVFEDLLRLPFNVGGGELAGRGIRGALTGHED